MRKVLISAAAIGTLAIAIVAIPVAAQHREEEALRGAGQMARQAAPMVQNSADAALNLDIGPILDANGWAVNGRARVNVAFGAAMTELAKLPKGSHRSIDDPFADKKTPWKRWVFLVVLLVLAGTWYVGKLDNYLPKAITSVEVLGSNAPRAKKMAAEKEIADKLAKEKAEADKAAADKAAAEKLPTPKP